MPVYRNSLTHPIRVDTLPVFGGILGLTFCPGKHGDSLTGLPWSRDLDVDLAALRDWGARLVVSLMEQHELDLLRVPDLPEEIIAHGMDWGHLPITDQGVPGAAFQMAWPRVLADVLRRLQSGSSVILHCRGGLGRTGLVAALLLIESGMKPVAAIQQVRRVRPGAIETDAQERFVQRYSISNAQ